jgi:hypothetical protein
MQFTPQDIRELQQRRTPLKHEPRVLCKVTVRPTSLMLPAPTTFGVMRLEQGTHVVELYKSDYERIKADCVTDQDSIQFAKRKHARELEDHVKKHGPDSARTYGGSVEAEYHELEGKDLPGIEAIEFMEELPPPALKASAEQADLIGQAVSQAVATALEHKLALASDGSRARKT